MVQNVGRLQFRFFYRNVSTTISSDRQITILDVPESAAHSNLVFKLTVTDDKDDSGTDNVTVEAE
ncbi:MAG: hypothetical protein ACP5OH_05655 [Nitrososphaerota archaeon]